MPALIESYIKPEFLQHSSLQNHQKIRGWIQKSFSQGLLNKFKPLTQQILSVTEPSGYIVSLNDARFPIKGYPDQDVTILTANLWHDWPRQRQLRARLECFVELVKNVDADVILL